MSPQTTMKKTNSTTLKENALALSMRHSTIQTVFERFEGIDIHSCTFHGLVETLRERRDLTENGIMIMLSNKSMHETIKNPRCKIQLYPDDAFGMDPIYDSEEVTWAQPTIAEDLQQLGVLASSPEQRQGSDSIRFLAALSH